MVADTRIKANAIDDLLGVQPLAFCVGIQFIEISHAQSQIGVSEQLDRLGLSEAHEQCVNVLLDCTFLEQTSKLMCGFHQTFIVQVSTNDDTGRIQVIVKGFRFTQEFRAKNNILAVELLSYTCRIAHRNRGLNNHDGVWVIFHNQLDYSFNSRRIKVLGLAVIVSRCRNHNKIRIAICCLCIQRCGQIQVLFCQVFFNIIILNRRFLVVDHIDLSLHNIDCNYLMMLAQKHSQRKSNVSRAGHSDFIIFHSSILPH